MLKNGSISSFEDPIGSTIEETSHNGGWVSGERGVVGGGT